MAAAYRVLTILDHPSTVEAKSYVQPSLGTKEADEETHHLSFEIWMRSPSCKGKIASRGLMAKKTCSLFLHKTQNT